MNNNLHRFCVRENGLVIDDGVDDVDDDDDDDDDVVVDDDVEGTRVMITTTMLVMRVSGMIRNPHSGIVPCLLLLFLLLALLAITQHLSL